MRNRWPLLAILCFLASLLVPGIASASVAPGAETRVWAFDLADGVRIGGSASLTLELHRGCERTYDHLAFDSLLAARGASGVGDALKGLRAGSSSRVRLVDSADELEGVFGRLSAGGKPLEGTTYPGRLMQLPDSTRVGIRPTSSSGGPTIDIHPPSGPGWKVHVGGGS
jgi:hypothetical protein